MPLKKLYLSSASGHPGTGVIGGGRAAVQVVMEDLGIDFEKVAAKKS
jgi:phytoene dehydrogenase-like protein